jgi:hypothetical protein
MTDQPLHALARLPRKRIPTAGAAASPGRAMRR